MNQATPTTSVAAKLVGLAIPSRFRLSAALFLIFFAAFFCTPVSGATNGTVKVGSIQWQLNQEAAQRAQQRTRMYVPVPGTALIPNAPHASGAFPAPPKSIADPATLTAAPTGSYPEAFVSTALILIAGLVAFKIFAPQTLEKIRRRINRELPEAAGGYQENIRAEEAAFNRFLAGFKAGSPNSGPEPQSDQPDPLGDFYPEAVRLLGDQKKLLQQIRDETNDPAKQKLLVELHASLVVLKNRAAFPEVFPVRHAALALAGLVNHLTGKLAGVNASTLQTIAGGLDLLGEICAPGLLPDSLTKHPLKFLVVDDDLISRQAMALALKKAFGDPDVALEGATALAMAEKQPYDVIFLDVQMPGMDGFELCTKIRETGVNRATPVIFVTTESDFAARRKSVLCGGNDLLGKPFFIFEITVKALTVAWRGRLAQQNVSPKPRRNANPAGAPVTEPSPARVPLPTAAPLARPTSAPASSSDQEPAAEPLSRVAAHVGTVSDFCRMISETPDAATRQNLLADVLLHVSSIVSRNPATARHPVSQISLALEGLLKKMLQNAGNSTPSAVASVNAAVNLLLELCDPNLPAPDASQSPWNILVVDDDLITRRVIVSALQTYFTRPEGVENGEEALHKAAAKRYDIIFMDVVMPGLDGFETCAQIRETTANRTTPVVFVTSDFATRTLQSQALGHEMMAKPFLIPEIMVKALTLAIRSRLPARELAAPV